MIARVSSLLKSLSQASSDIQKRRRLRRRSVALETLESRALLAAFTAGNLAVVRLDGNGAAPGAAAAAVFIDEYTPTGTLVQSIPLPTTGSDQLTMAGSATSEGLLSLSADRTAIFFGGYDAAPGTANLSATTGTTVQRKVGKVNFAGTLSTTLLGTAAFSGSNIRGVTSSNGTDFWAVGGNTGVIYGTMGTAGSTVISTTVTNQRGIQVAGGNLYTTTGSGTSRLMQIGTGLPTTAGTVAANIPGSPTGAPNNSPYGFFYADLDAGVAGVDTLYVADDTTNSTTNGGLRKYSLVGGTWVLNGLIAPGLSASPSVISGTRGLSGSVSGSTVTLFGTSNGTAGTVTDTIYSVVDTTGYNGSWASPPTPTLITTLTTANNLFRGISFAPVPSDTTPPTVSTLSPADNATNVAVGSNLAVTFNENIVKGAGNILIRRTSDNTTAFTIDVTSSTVTVSGAVLTIDPPSDLGSSTEYYVQIPSGAVTDTTGNAFAGITDTTSWSFTTAAAADLTAPTVTAFSPADNATGVALNTDLVVTFSEPVVKGTGNILVKRTSDDSVVHTIDVTSGLVTIASNVVTINPSTDFLNNVGYYVEIPNTSFKDASNNFYVGTVDKNTWNFTTVADTTPPTVLTIDDGDADNAVVTNVLLTYTITFSEDIDSATVTAVDFDNAGTSNITIGTITETSPGVFTVQVTPTSAGTLILRIPTGSVITDTAGNPLAVPVSDNDTLTVTEPDVTAPTVSSIVDDRSGNPVNLNIPVIYTITFSEDINLATVSSADFDNAGTATVTFGTIAEPSPGVVTIVVTATSTGTLQLRIPVGATILDPSGNALAPPVVDDTTITVNGVTTLTAGDIAFTGLQTDDPDTFSFVLLKDVVDGTQIRFTDNRWSSTTETLTTNENTMTLTFQNGGSGFTAGTHFVNVNGGAAPAFRVVGTSTSAGLVAGTINGLSANGDSLLAYQGAAPTSGTSSAWIAGINSRNWSSGATTNESELPAALTLGVNAIQLSTSATDVDNGAFQIASFVGSVAEIRTVVNDLRNWTTNNAVGPLSLTTFSVVTTSTDLFVSEVVFNPFAATDTGEEYIELRGTPGTYLPGTAYLLLLEGDSEDGTGNIDHRFYLGGMQFGSNGFLVLRQFGSTYSVNSSSTVMTATASGWGASWSSRDTDIENGSVSVLLIQSTAAPVVDTDVDSNDDGNLDGDATTWTIRDSFGNIDGGASDTGYGTLNTTGNGNGAVPTGSTLINLSGYHPDYVARNGLSTGYSLLNTTATDWVVGELAGLMPTISLATGGFTRPAAYEGASLNHLGAVNNFAAGNRAPTNINLSASTLAENAGANAVIGTLSAVDPDSGDTFTFSLPAGVDNNSLFNISGTSLRATSSFDFEAGSTYTITARVTDAGGLTFDKQFTITITNVNETPTNINLSASTLAENAGTNAVIGTLSAVDPDSGDTFTFSLPAGLNNNNLFNISGTSLRATSSFDFEAGSTYTITARVTDAGGLTFDKQFTITITNVNETPTNINLSASTLAENAGTNAVIGTLSAVDPDSGDTFTFSLPAGLSNNNLFNISGTSLRATSSFDFEAGSTYTITARVTDAGGLTFDKQFTITITNVNETPTNINLSASTLAENAGANAVIGTLSAVDPDSGDTFTFSLPAGVDNNNLFNISGTSLRATSSFDFEAGSTYTITARVADAGGLTFDKQFTITITNVNETPTNINLSASTLAENAGANAVIGTLSAVDPDSGDSFTFTLPAGLNNNNLFNISGTSLRATSSFDFEAGSTYTITARVTDAGGLTFDKQFTITITNVNETPTNINLSASTLAENAGTNAVIGTLSAVDPDSGDTFTFSLPAGLNNNNLFNISGTSLRATSSFDFEAGSTYTITARVTDAGGLTFDKQFTITITNVNETPTNINLSASTLAENAGTNAVIGTLSAVDPDSGDTFTFSLPAGLSNNNLFNISGTSLRATSSFDFEAGSTYTITARVTDAGGLTFDKQFTITITNVNETPTNINLSASTLAENAGANAVIGTLSAVDPDSGDTFTFSLPAGLSNNSLFNISGTSLRATSSFDFEAGSTYTITARATDAGGLTFDKQFTITITNVNETPTNINLSASTLAENAGANAVIGTLSAVDPDSGDTFTFSLPAGLNNNNLFNISGTSLRATSSFDFEAGSTYTITARVTDAGGLTFDKQFTITITNVNETPTNINLSASTLTENAGANAVIGTLSAVDPDSGDTFTFSLPAGLNNNNLFNISGTSLRATSSFDFEAGSTYTITARVTDAGGLTFDKQFTITITNVNETPTNINLSASTLAENAGANAVIGTLSAVDPDSGDTFTFTLPAGLNNNSLFNISGTSLRATSSFDFEASSTYTITARVTDAGGLTFDKQFTITISDVNEATLDGALFYNTNAAAEKNFTPDQTGQRSMIRNVQVVFNGDVSVPTGPVTNSSFVLTRLGATPASIGLTVVSRAFAAGKTTVVLGFTSGTSSVSGSLNDGNYRLVIDYGVLGIDGDGNGQLGGTRTISFHRFFGDSDGDRDVDARDAANYRSALQGVTTWRSIFDFDNDGILITGSIQDQQDKDAFFANYGRLLSPL